MNPLQCETCNKYVKYFICGLESLKPLVNLGVRIWLGLIFWKSGYLKINNWDTTILLFTYEHPVPYLPVTFAAISGTAAELLFSVMLFIGFGARFAALGLLGMTVLIHFTYQQAADHYFWMAAAGIIMIYGAGKLSIDHFIRKKCLGYHLSGDCGKK